MQENIKKTKNKSFGMQNVIIESKFTLFFSLKHYQVQICNK